MKAFFILMLALPIYSTAAPWPTQPTDLTHPGSSNYSYQSTRETISVNGRSVDVFYPTEHASLKQKVPVIVFGHGQAMNVGHYDKTFEHLAKKGMAVIHPTFDTGFFDQEWRRMAADYNKLTALTLQKYNFMDAEKVVFAGHSKGGYIALMAAGLPAAQMQVKPKALVLFAPAGYDREYLAQIETQVPVSLFWSQSDTVIKKSAIEEIYGQLRVQKKQMFVVSDYKNTEPALPADHFFSSNKKALFGGRDGISPFHYFGVWPWLMAAAQDISSGDRVDHPFLYGERALETGVTGHQHTVQKNW